MACNFSWRFDCGVGMAVQKLDQESASSSMSLVDKVWYLKPLTGNVLMLKGEMTLGTEDGCDLQLEGTESIKVRAVSLADGILFEDLSGKSSMTIDGAKCTQGKVAGGEYVRFGARSFQVTAEQSAQIKPVKAVGSKTEQDLEGPQGTMMISESQLDQILPAGKSNIGVTHAEAAVLVGAGALRGQVFELKEGKNTVGRDPNNSIVLNEDSVSSTHAEIVVNGTNCKVINLLSSNGTFINGEKITSSYLKPGDKVSFGRAKFIYRVPTEDSPEEELVGGGSSNWLLILSTLGVLSGLAVAAYLLM